MKISDQLLQRTRRISLDLMPDQVTIRVPGDPVPDGRGGQTVPYIDGETVACRWRQAKGKLDELVANRAQNREVYEFSMPYDVTLSETSRLRQGEIEYEIVSAVSGNSYDIVQRVLACKVVS